MKVYKPNPSTGKMEVFESNPGDNLRYHVSPRYTNRQSINGPFVSETTNSMLANQSVNPLPAEIVENNPVEEVMALNNDVFADPNINSVVIDDALPLDDAEDEYIDIDLNLIKEWIDAPLNPDNNPDPFEVDDALPLDKDLDETEYNNNLANYTSVASDENIINALDNLTKDITLTEDTIVDTSKTYSSIDYGLYQINDFHHSKEKQAETYRKLGYDDRQISMMTKDTKKLGKSWRSNIRYAKHLSEAEGWDTWTSYNNKSYEQFLDYTNEDYINAGVDSKYLDYIDTQFNDEFTLNQITLDGQRINIGDKQNYPDSFLIERIKGFEEAKLKLSSASSIYFDKIIARFQDELDIRLEKDNNTKIAKAVMMAESGGDKDSVNYNK